MKTQEKYKVISVTVPSPMERALSEHCRRELRKKSTVVQEALRLYFKVYGKPSPASLIMPSDGEEQASTDYGALSEEWAGNNDKAYDVLAK